MKGSFCCHGNGINIELKEHFNLLLLARNFYSGRLGWLSQNRSQFWDRKAKKKALWFSSCSCFPGGYGDGERHRGEEEGRDSYRRGAGDCELMDFLDIGSSSSIWRGGGNRI